MFAVHASQVEDFIHVALIENMLTKQWNLDKALNIAGGRMEYEKLLP